MVDDRAAGASLLDRAGADGGRTLVVGEDARAGEDGAAAPAPGAERLLAHVRGQGRALTLAGTLLHDTWLVEDIDALAPGFGGVAVTRQGRVWSARTRELRQAPAVGEDRVLAERNRREQLVAESERAAQAEVGARAGVERATAAMSQADSARDRLTNAHRAAVRMLDERLRGGAPAHGTDRAPPCRAGRRAQAGRGPAGAELAAERRMLERAERERTERSQRLERVRAGIARDTELMPAVAGLIDALEEVTAAIGERLASFEEALAADRQAGEHVALELRACAQQEAELHAKISQENETLTQAEVRLQRARDQAGDAETELGRIAQRLELPAEPAAEALTDEERQTLDARLERIARRREQLGPVNPLAQEEYAEAVAHVEELETQRADLESALRELEKLIADTDKQIRTTFEQTFAATAAAFEELAGQLFPGGEGRLRLVSEREGPARVIGGQEAPDADSDGDGDDGPDDELEREEDLLGVEIEITPAGKECKRLSLLSGGEKSMTALAFLFAVFLARPCPFYILDEVEAALDDLNIDRFLALLRQYSSRAQFIVVTHQKRTMEAADSLYGVSMGSDGISKVISRKLSGGDGPTDAEPQAEAA